MTNSARRPTPDELLRQVQADEWSEHRGRLKVFLGYASGVGKSFRMLDEGRRRKERGEDVVVGALQPRTDSELEPLLQKMEVVPLRYSEEVAAMDVAAVLRRRPHVCLVDALAHNNPPGSANRSRWQDVRQVLDAGIDVITSVNVQYIEELRERVEGITGKHVEQTVPKSFLFGADEISLVDAPAGTTLSRTQEAARPDGDDFARGLSELREIALLLAADVVDHQLETYLQRNGVSASLGAQERILVCVTPRANARTMIESGRRNADRFHGELVVAYVRQPELSADDQVLLDRNLAIAREVGAEIQILEGEEPIGTILQFARNRGVTQIFVGHSLEQKWWQRWTGSHVDRLVRGAKGMDVRIFPH
ncbi:MAG: hypothetical protein ABIR70_06760 [Bryobacteraceae bacterium]